MDKYAEAIGQGIGGVIGELAEGVMIAVHALKQQPGFDAASFDKVIADSLERANGLGKQTTAAFLKELL
ncbi:hypothetical protein SB18R_04240 [Pseudomonas oryzihabitans]|nr:hypothetical protein SB9_15960 [Pseudomonas psychrotolerans]KTT77872.1 hypothetical protein SB18R_04240 [Pseudomonas psychrotolerans]